jgi:hypothetical protein
MIKYRTGAHRDQQHLENTDDESKKKFAHIVMDITQNPNVMVCEICKARQVLPEGAMPVQILQANLDSFMSIHKKCKTH